MSDRAASSQTETAYAGLRGELLACRLIPGQKLKIDELCRRLSVGSSAIREALSRLASDGLVDFEPNRGFRVKPLSLVDLQDLTQARCLIEGNCIEESLRYGDLEWETNLVAALHRLSRTPVQDALDTARYSDHYSHAHQAFHQALVAACRNPWLLQIRQMLFVQHQRYRWLSRPLAKVERNLEAEHRNIANAAVARDVARTVALMTEHMRLTARIIITAGTVTHQEQALTAMLA